MGHLYFKLKAYTFLYLKLLREGHDWMDESKVL